MWLGGTKMISINNGPQGMYIAGEGLEQKLFQVGSNIVLFNGSVNTKILKYADYYKDGFDALVQRASRDYCKGSVIVCGVKNDSAVVYSAGGNKVQNVSAGYDSKEVKINISAESLLDFVDFVEHSQSTQFGFVVCNRSAELFSPAVKLDKYVPVMYQKKELSEFCGIAFSWLNSILHNNADDLRVYAQNLCGLDVDYLSKILLSSDNMKTFVHDCARDTLLPGTSAYAECLELVNNVRETTRVANEVIESQRRIIEQKDTIANNWLRSIRIRDHILYDMYSLLKEVEFNCNSRAVVRGRMRRFDELARDVSEQHEKYFGAPLSRTAN